MRGLITSSLGANIAVGYTVVGMVNAMSTEGWAMSRKYDSRGLEVERELSGEVKASYEYDSTGRIARHRVRSTYKGELRSMRYWWGINDRLFNIVDDLKGEITNFDYDSRGFLTFANYGNIEKLFRMPDTVGNLYKNSELEGRKYGKAGELLDTEKVKLKYDDDGNLSREAIAIRGCRNRIVLQPLPLLLPRYGDVPQSRPDRISRNNPKLYGYVFNTTIGLDVFGLELIDPTSIKFSQNNISSIFSDGSNVKNTIDALRANPILVEEIEPIRIIKLEDIPDANVRDKLIKQGAQRGDIFTLDNRRLYAVREAGVNQINTRAATQADLDSINLKNRFSRTNGGFSIKIRRK